MSAVVENRRRRILTSNFSGDNLDARDVSSHRTFYNSEVTDSLELAQLGNEQNKKYKENIKRKRSGAHYTLFRIIEMLSLREVRTLCGLRRVFF